MLPTFTFIGFGTTLGYVRIHSALILFLTTLKLHFPVILKQLFKMLLGILPLVI